MRQRALVACHSSTFAVFAFTATSLAVALEGSAASLGRPALRWEQQTLTMQQMIVE